MTSRMENPISKEKEKERYGWEVQFSDRVLVKHARPGFNLQQHSREGVMGKAASVVLTTSPQRPYIIPVQVQKT